MGRKHAPLTSFKDRARSGLVRARQHARGWYAGHHRAHVPKWRSRRCGEASPSVTLIAEEFGTQLLVGPFEGIGHAVHCARLGAIKPSALQLNPLRCRQRLKGGRPLRSREMRADVLLARLPRRARRSTVRCTTGPLSVPLRIGDGEPSGFRRAIGWSGRLSDGRPSNAMTTLPRPSRSFRYCPRAPRQRRQPGPTIHPPASRLFRSPPTEAEWQTQLAAQTRITISAQQALDAVQKAWCAAVSPINDE
jgi:hypothetical protein